MSCCRPEKEGSAGRREKEKPGGEKRTGPIGTKRGVYDAGQAKWL
jgi:hypothetical protein